MIKTINFSEFCDAFKNYDRDNNFSYDGKRALFDYLENYEEETGEKIELDIIALCCEYNEYKNLTEYLKDYSSQHDEQNFNKINDETIKETDDDFKTRIEEEIADKTTLIKFNEDLNKGFIIQAY